MVRIAVVPGDGIGVEVTREAVKVLEAFRQRGLALELVPFDWGADRYLKDGVALPAGAVEDLRDNYAAILFGAVGDPRIPDMAHGREILLGLRFKLDLYVNLRPVKLYDERLCPLKGRTRADVDMVVLRENTEGAYVGMGGNFKKGTPDEVAIQEDLNTRKGVERIIRAAFVEAGRPGRRKQVCMTDKANALRYSGDLWQRTFREVARDYPGIEASHLYVDVLAMEMVRNPQRFDVIVTNNLFGDILTDLGAGIAGGLGVAASGNINPGRCSLFEPVHGSAPDIAGKGVANPMGSILTAAMLLEHVGQPAEAQQIVAAVERALAENVTTRDLGGNRATTEVGDFIVRALGEARG